ncbi:hypothetical protein [Corynebacterium sp.]|uniref:hypothetical protein n=1 Tax=Corynebacterium sp. TaxID=1720 RepID=UPI0037362CB7
MGSPQRGQVDERTAGSIALAALASAEFHATGVCPAEQQVDQEPLAEGDSVVR